MTTQAERQKEWTEQFGDHTECSVCGTAREMLYVENEKEEKRFRLLSDNDGHHYLVPAEKEDEFNAWVDSFNEDEEGDPDGYEKLGAVSLGCSPTCVSFTNPQIS